MLLRLCFLCTTRLKSWPRLSKDGKTGTLEPFIHLAIHSKPNCTASSGFSYASLARVVTAADTDAGRLHLAEAVVDCMRTYTSLCGSVRAVATAELLQLLQLRRLPPAFISHCVRRLDPSECGFVNSSVVREFLCACSILRVSTLGLMQSRVHLVEKSVYSQWLKRIKVCVCMALALHVLGMIQGRMMSWRFSHPGVEDGGSWTMLAQKCMIL